MRIRIDLSRIEKSSTCDKRDTDRKENNKTKEYRQREANRAIKNRL